MRYWLFASEDYEQAGGLDDVVAKSDNINDFDCESIEVGHREEHIFIKQDNQTYGWYHVLDTTTMKVVRSDDANMID